mmetsp:Transcript_20833/g.51665  ORF Transcript_20833/g.51665 Transcript_20833/m.51665 type:complete len:168 (-) Transcript_20833:120-623(-)
MSAVEHKISLRITGLGNKFDLNDLPAEKTTVADLRLKVAERTGVPPRFQKFLGPQKLNITYNEECDLAEKSLADLRIQDRTRLLLLHAPNYQMEKEGYQQLLKVQDEINILEKKHSKSLERNRATKVCGGNGDTHLLQTGCDRHGGIQGPAKTPKGTHPKGRTVRGL